MSAPNLDAMSAGELWELQDRIGREPLKVAEEFFPVRPPKYVAQTKQLGAYACNKSVAMKCRVMGDVEAAIIYEKICDNIYDKLLEFAKW